jgi:hypothetical protein
MTHVPNSVLSKPPAELGSGPESNPIAKAAAAESVRQAQGESGFSSATGMAARAPVRSERVDIHGFDESSRQKDQCERQTWDENEERSFEIEWRSLSDKESERGDDEQVSGSSQRVQSARAKPLQTLDCRMSASCGRKAERENKGRQQQQASAPLGAAHLYRNWNRNATPRGSHSPSRSHDEFTARQGATRPRV